MCGIRCFLETSFINQKSTRNKEAEYDVPEWLARRGPDHVGCGQQHYMNLQASVLQMRSELVVQPVLLLGEENDGPSKCWLAWNGEIYQRHSDNEQIEDTSVREVSDTKLVASLVKEALVKCLNTNDDTLLLKQLAHDVFGKLINAEYAFCLLTPTCVFYGRDLLGRRSLLHYVPHDSQEQQQEEAIWKIASVADSTTAAGTWREVEAGIVFCYNWNNGATETSRISTASRALPTISTMEQASVSLEALLKLAVQRRIESSDSGLAILFSGGLDSVVLAALACEIEGSLHKPIELINVSFVDDQFVLSADTLAARASFQDLERLFPHHQLRLVEVQVCWEEVKATEERIRHLIYPKTTLMDVNIGTALWFAARGATSNILLSGLGADEQMAGYGRHRKSWRGGKLREELDMDMERLWDRNLGRDDRVFSDHGKEARYPYLDHHVVTFLSQLPLDLVCDFSLPPGEGDKRILRLMAFRMGLLRACTAVKRAIQFGSRISHVSDKRRFGSRRKASGTKQCIREPHTSP